jgi:hypothetical protein
VTCSKIFLLLGYQLTIIFYRVMANKRISRHRLLVDTAVKGNLQGLLERGVQESMDKEEVFDETLEVAIGYAGSIGTALWSEIREDRDKVCPGYAVVLIEFLRILWAEPERADFFCPGPC